MTSATTIQRAPAAFGFFDPEAEYTVTYGNLPHWEQEGATYFITFRTADSISHAAMKLWQRERHDWLRRNHIDPESRGWGRQLARLPWATQRAFHREFATKLELRLDELQGECLLGRPGIAERVADALHHFDGSRYRLGDFVVMPNHVHVMVCFLKEIRLLRQCRSWKHYTARVINRALQRSGRFWQQESFDHLVRDAEHFARFQRYIRGNADQARRHGDKCVHYELQP